MKKTNYVFLSASALVVGLFCNNSFANDLSSLIQNNTGSNSHDLNSNANLTEDLGNLGGTELIINGDSTSEIDGQDQLNPTIKHAGVSISDGQTFETNNISLIKNFLAQNGGVINNSGNFNASNTTFDSNLASGNGGAIYNTGITNISNSKFKNNGDFGDVGGYHVNTIEGGAIWSNKELTITNSSFESNRAHIGGAIFNNGKLIINGDTDSGIGKSNKFTNNYAVSNGGAILNMTNGKMNIAETLFSANDALDGGAIYNGGTMTTTNTNFENNNARQGGGAIFNTGNANFDNSNFIQNTSGHADGGAINNSGTVTLTNTTFGSNSTDEGNGGAISNTGKLTVTSADFSQNMADAGKGGAIYNSGTIPTTIKDSSFNMNSAKDGGAIWSDTDIEVSKNSESAPDTANKFTDNLAYNNGGAIYASANTTLNGTTFEHNIANLYGGAIYNTGTLTADNTLFNNNFAQQGSALYNTGTATVIRSIISNNGLEMDEFGDISGTSSYGAVYNKATLTVSDSEFNNNTAQNGAALYNETTASATLTNVKFKNNGQYNDAPADGNTSINGGAIYNLGTLTLNNSSFTENVAKSNGGAIYNLEKISEINANFTKNSATSANNMAYGGAISNGKTINLLHDTMFSGNYAHSETDQAYAGALYNGVGGATIDEIRDSSFEGNYAVSKLAEAYGGAISSNTSTNTNAKISNIINTDFIGNYVKTEATGKQANGGAIASMGDLTITADVGSSLFSGNYAEDSEGNKVANAIYLLSTGKNINLTAVNDGTIQFDDQIDGKTNFGNASYDINIKGDTTGEVIFNNAIKNAANININDGTTLTIGSHVDANRIKSQGSINNANLNINNGTLNLENDEFQSINVKNFNSTGNAGIKFDADLNTGFSDTITAQTVTPDSKIKLEKVNITADGTEKIVLFANGIAPEFTNLNDFAAFTADYKYKFSNGDIAGVLNSSRGQSNGLSDAMADETGTKSYTVAESGNVSADLGNLAGGDNATLNILGNNNILDGESHAGMIIGDSQTVGMENVASVENFNSNNGGVIHNSGTLNLVNTSFKNNTATGDGGAIWSESDVNVVAQDNSNVEFTDNTANGNSNAIYMANASAGLNIEASDNSALTFNDGIDGINGYNINVSGDNTGRINLNEAVSNAGTINMYGSQLFVADDTFLNNSSINLSGGNLHFDNTNSNQTIKLSTLSGGNGVLHLDVDPFGQVSDVMEIETLNGTVKIVGHLFDSAASGPITFADPANSTAPVAKTEGDGMVFAKVENNNGNFDILRVEGSAFDWEAKYDDIDKSYAMFMRAPSAGKSLVNAETIAYLGLNTAGFEQTRSMIRNIENKTMADAIYINCCGGYYDKYFDAEPLYNVWVSPVYNTASVSKPVKFDADISGLEAGGDVQIDAYNRAGIFASYRKGKYDFDGRSDFYTSLTASEIDIDSYITGLYYKYNNRNFWAMATVFGGIQKADIKTNDGLKTDTDGTEFGGSLSTGYAFYIGKTVIIEPMMRASYTQIAYDDIKDKYGKTAKYDTASQTEFEAGVKFEKTVYKDSGYTKVYVKPSIIQTLVSGDSVNITSLDSLHTMRDQTLGRAEAGISTDLSEALSTFGSASYTFGSGYHDTSFNLGLNYAF